MKKIIMYLLATIIISSCSTPTSLGSYNSRTVTLPAGMRLIEATLEKDSSMWLYMESMDSLYIPKTKVLQKNSKYGIVERKVAFKESK